VSKILFAKYPATPTNANANANANSKYALSNCVLAALRVLKFRTCACTLVPPVCAQFIQIRVRHSQPEVTLLYSTLLYSTLLYSTLLRDLLRVRVRSLYFKSGLEVCAQVQQKYKSKPLLSLLLAVGMDEKALPMLYPGRLPRPS